jgi:hypothetical protein
MLEDGGGLLCSTMQGYTYRGMPAAVDDSLSVVPWMVVSEYGAILEEGKWEDDDSEQRGSGGIPALQNPLHKRPDPQSSPGGSVEGERSERHDESIGRGRAMGSDDANSDKVWAAFLTIATLVLLACAPALVIAVWRWALGLGSC